MPARLQSPSSFYLRSSEQVCIYVVLVYKSCGDRFSVLVGMQRESLTCPEWKLAGRHWKIFGGGEKGKGWNGGKRRENAKKWKKQCRWNEWQIAACLVCVAALQNAV